MSSRMTHDHDHDLPRQYRPLSATNPNQRAQCTPWGHAPPRGWWVTIGEPRRYIRVVLLRGVWCEVKPSRAPRKAAS
jgi:hypothetical protein